MAEQSTPQTTFSFRWGVDLFDNEHTQIPNWILAYYHQVPWANDDKSGKGISNTEMMFIIHLSSFKYESDQDQVSPSLTKTLLKRMGYKTNQGIINIQQGLVDKGLLIVHKRAGQRSVYDFTPFSKKAVEIAVRAKGEKYSEKLGFVYLMNRQNGHCKIGSSNNPNRRLKEIGEDHRKVEVIHTITCDNMILAEMSLHNEFAPKRKDGEWFDLTDEDVNSIVKRVQFSNGEFLVVERSMKYE